MLEKLMVFVEEISMEAALEQLMPKLLDDIEFEIFRFQCKDDLLKNLPARLRAYSTWLPPEWAILVLVDRDNSDCRELKQQLEGIAQAAGLQTKSQGVARFQVANRIVIEELEAWFFGDWVAVKAAYPRVQENIPQKASFRDPDAIKGGTWEALERVLKKAGYFSVGINKLQCAREVAAHMIPEANRSASFQAMVAAVEAARAWD
ncbi:DUF4276 family protein [Marinobacterium sedimentorum]|uniref:DUF4276 family protein n=1 Tax=Marinobacterium sedimentorum TaxID=2927804 RepID=UPI0020C63784|nr:DUF4276 family protein [Marinobacterium sedimentorum]MCP8687153.1 DUF4276 family protein [Marinobacterium sedimentorum]